MAKAIAEEWGKYFEAGLADGWSTKGLVQKLTAEMCWWNQEFGLQLRL